MITHTIINMAINIAMTTPTVTPTTIPYLAEPLVVVMPDADVVIAVVQIRLINQQPQTLFSYNSQIMQIVVFTAAVVVLILAVMLLVTILMAVVLVVMDGKDVTGVRDMVLVAVDKLDITW